VKTSIGTIRGRIVDAPQGGSSVAEYLGIPFAKPPLGDLRYADPEPLYTLPSGNSQAHSAATLCSYLHQGGGYAIGAVLFVCQSFGLSFGLCAK